MHTRLVVVQDLLARRKALRSKETEVCPATGSGHVLLETEWICGNMRMVRAGTHGVSARRSSNMMCMLDEKCCATRCNEGVCNACMCRDSRFKQLDMRAARSPTAPGYTAVGMSLSTRSLRVSASSDAH